MNTLGLLQSDWNPSSFMLTLQDNLKYSWFHEQMKNWIYCLKLHFVINIWNIKIIFDLGIKTVLYLKYKRINCFVRV